uniref:Uncharacterized protein n=1 Tax=viral metagenome TaxID=1070528 RepID=A0A6M3KFS2_9ZZZZ
MISEIGCTADGGVWVGLLMEVKGEQLKAILPMDAKKAREVRDAMTNAINQGQQWLISGVPPAKFNGGPGVPNIKDYEVNADERDGPNPD